MLKILFGVLLAINGGLLAYQQGWLDALMPPSHEPSRLSQQLHPERLTIIPPTPPVEKAAEPPTETPAPVATSTPASEAPAATETSTAAVAACTEIGNFDTTEAQRFESRLASLALGERLVRREVQDNMRHIVYIPPLGNKEAADRKGSELTKLGVTDYFVIQDSSPLQWGISLGVFRTEESARNHLATLTQKGVRSAKVGMHGVGATRVVFQLRGIDAATRQNIDRIKEAFPRQQWRDCA